MRVSTTERQTYKRCRRKWNYTSYNRQSLSPVINAPALDLGTVVHATLAKWTRNPGLDPNQIYQDVSYLHLNQLIIQYTAKVGCAPSDAELKPSMEAMVLGKYMIQNYQQRWTTPIPPGFELVENELSIIQPVPGTEHVVCEHEEYCLCGDDCCGIAWPSCDWRRPNTSGTALCSRCSHIEMHELECTFDGLMRDADGNYYIIERKTFSRTPSLDELNNNDQFLAYQWAACQALGIDNVVGISYDGLLKKPAPSGTHRTLQDLFLRRILLRPKHELEEFGVLLAQELNEMASPNVPIYKTVPPVMGCQRWECSFIDLCQATSKGEPTDHLQRMFVHSDRKSHLDTNGVSASEP